MIPGEGLYRSPRVAAGYAYARPAVHPRILARVQAALRLDAPLARALDVGCGAGRSTAALEPLARQVVGLDPAVAMLQHRRDVAPGAGFAVGRAECLPFGEGVFDLVTAAGALNYAEADVALPEIARVLTPGGAFVIYDFSAGRRFAGDRRLETWYAEFDARYPEPPGYAMDVVRLPFDRAGLALDRYEKLEALVAMTLDAYLRYVMSETRIELAIAAGAGEMDIREWCGATLARVFGGEPRDVVFDCWFACVRHRARTRPAAMKGAS
jgi:ubiquinone/menaquinone biosynthesis C-methylase UbiE